ncbi:hypothetical protein AB0B89_05640 [Sphaerisporangium sp. NPDC049002]|uniref:hypothetical protein n=1 Tax=unclassified Sphaerisporangium TaxID=2630420 RepID=UPI0033FFB3D0
MRGRLKSIVLGIEVAVLLAVCAPMATAASGAESGGDGDGRRSNGEVVPGRDGSGSTGVSVQVLPAPTISPTVSPTPLPSPHRPEHGTGGPAPHWPGDLPAGTSIDESGSRDYGTWPDIETHSWSNHVEVREFGHDPSADTETSRITRHQPRDELPAGTVPSAPNPAPRQSGKLPFTGMDAQSVGIVVAGSLAAIILGAFLVSLSIRRRRPAPRE